MTAAFVFVQMAMTAGWPDASSMHDAFHAVPGVKTVHFVAGPTDVVIFVEAADQNGLIASVGKIRAVKGVASTDTRIVFPV